MVLMISACFIWAGDEEGVEIIPLTPAQADSAMIEERRLDRIREQEETIMFEHYYLKSDRRDRHLKETFAHILERKWLECLQCVGKDAFENVVRRYTIWNCGYNRFVDKRVFLVILEEIPNYATFKANDTLYVVFIKEGKYVSVLDMERIKEVKKAKGAVDYLRFSDYGSYVSMVKTLFKNGIKEIVDERLSENVAQRSVYYSRKGICKFVFMDEDVKIKEE